MKKRKQRKKTSSRPIKEKEPNEEPATIALALGSILRELRLKKLLSQTALSQNTGISRPWLSMVEKGQGNISFVDLYKVAKILRISTWALVRQAEGRMYRVKTERRKRLRQG